MNNRVESPPDLIDSLKFCGLMLLVVVACFYTAAWLAAGLFACLHESGSFLEDVVLSRGPHKLMRRLLSIFVVLAFIMLLKRAGWKGWSHCGLTDPNTGRLPTSWEKTWLKGVLLGLVSLGVFSAASLLLDIRIIDSDHSGVDRFLHLSRYFFSGLVIGVLEETLARGILFQSLIRLISVWPAALLSSLLFAIGHFLKPSEAAFTGQSIFADGNAALASMFEYLMTTPQIELRILNLTLMSVVLCMMFYRSGTIWMIAGLHTGWVWVKLSGSYLLNVNRDLDYQLLLGQRSDHTDSVFASAMLFSLLIVALVYPKKKARASAHD